MKVQKVHEDRHPVDLVVENDQRGEQKGLCSGQCEAELWPHDKVVDYKVVEQGNLRVGREVPGSGVADRLKSSTVKVLSFR